MESCVGNWSLGLDYHHIDLGSVEWKGKINETANGTENSLLADIEGDGKFDYQFSVVRATAKIRF